MANDILASDTRRPAAACRTKEEHAAVTRTIGSLAEAVDVPISTVRYYERIGLLQPSGRTTGNYRLYDEDTLKRLRFIRAAQAAGLTLEDIDLLLDLRDGVTEPCLEVEGLITERLHEVAHRIADLKKVRGELDRLLRDCRRSHTGTCGAVRRLSTMAATTAPCPSKSDI